MKNPPARDSEDASEPAEMADLLDNQP
jgi:hypothetical protein